MVMDVHGCDAQVDLLIATRAIPDCAARHALQPKLMLAVAMLRGFAVSAGFTVPTGSTCQRAPRCLHLSTMHTHICSALHKNCSSPVSHACSEQKTQDHVAFVPKSMLITSVSQALSTRGASAAA